MRRSECSWVGLSLSAWQATREAQQVIGLRLARLLGGDKSAWAEANRMTSEKISTLGETQTEAAAAVLTGRAAAVPARIRALYRRKMRANRKRLAAAGARRRS
jgi:hypothetical protein